MEEPEAKRAPRPLITALFKGDRYASLVLPQYRWLLGGTALSQVASWMEEVTRSWLVLQLTDSPFQLGLLAFIRGMSQLIVSPFAGVLVERFDRRQIAIFTQLMPASDALIVLQFDANLLDVIACQAAADANLDGHVNTRDAALILQFAARLVPQLPRSPFT